MASYNGLISTIALDGSTTSEVLGTTAVTYTQISDSVPAKYFKTGLFAVRTTGVSGAYFVNVVCSVGGATFLAAGITAVNAVGSRIMGATGSASFGVPRPAYVQWGSAGAIVGFTASVFFAGDY